MEKKKDPLRKGFSEMTTHEIGKDEGSGYAFNCAAKYST